MRIMTLTGTMAMHQIIIYGVCSPSSVQSDGPLLMIYCEGVQYLYKHYTLLAYFYFYYLL